jgi:hypothetical protein
MRRIRPVSGLHNKSSDASKIVRETQKPVFPAKNGYSDMAVTIIEAYGRKQFEREIYLKLKKAELEAGSTKIRYAHEDVFSNLRSILTDRKMETG